MHKGGGSKKRILKHSMNKDPKNMLGFVSDDDPFPTNVFRVLNVLKNTKMEIPIVKVKITVGLPQRNRSL